jgi:flagellar biosynthesis activator protein FlaF
MQTAAQTYGKVQQATANPRDLEADLLMKAAGKLQHARDDWGNADLDGALTYNRRLWTLLVTAVTAEDNPLPVQIKQNIANLAGFIFDRTLSIESRPDPDKLASLITINREIATGLRGR